MESDEPVYSEGFTYSNIIAHLATENLCDTLVMRLKAFLNRPFFKVAGLFYSVAWCKIIDKAETLGYCEDESKIIYIKDGQEIDLTFKTLLHELVHAMDHVYSMKLSHSQVRKLELALAEFLIQNDLIKRG